MGWSGASCVRFAPSAHGIAVRQPLEAIRFLAAIPMEASSLSQQLAVLRRTGLVRQQRIGGEVVYSIVTRETAELLLAARRLLRQRLADQDQLKKELEPLVGEQA